MEVTCYDNSGVEQYLDVGKTYKVNGTWKYGYYFEKEGKLLSFKVERFENKQEQPKPKAKKKTLFDNVFRNLK